MAFWDKPSGELKLSLETRNESCGQLESQSILGSNSCKKPQSRGASYLSLKEFMNKELSKEELELAILNAYQEKHKDRINKFVKENPGKSLPIFKDSNGNPTWMNRKDRRNRGLK